LLGARAQFLPRALAGRNLAKADLVAGDDRFAAGKVDFEQPLAFDGAALLVS
jgi:hypothetical protein